MVQCVNISTRKQASGCGTSHVPAPWAGSATECKHSFYCRNIEASSVDVLTLMELAKHPNMGPRSLGDCWWCRLRTPSRSSVWPPPTPLNFDGNLHSAASRLFCCMPVHSDRRPLGATETPSMRRLDGSRACVCVWQRALKEQILQSREQGLDTAPRVCPVQTSHLESNETSAVAAAAAVGVVAATPSTVGVVALASIPRQGGGRVACGGDARATARRDLGSISNLGICVESFWWCPPVLRGVSPRAIDAA